MARIGRRLALLFFSAAALAAMPQAADVARLPSHMAMTVGAAARLPEGEMLTAAIEDGVTAARLTNEGGQAMVEAVGEGQARLSWRLMGLLPVKRVSLDVADARRLIPGGQSVGVAIDTRGVIVVGASDLGGTASPARQAGLKPGDIIRRADGADIGSAEALSRAVQTDRPVRLEVERDGDVIECLVTPGLDRRDGSWRLGAWVRDSTAGIGTLTWVDPETGVYGALGHAITDVDTGVTMPVGQGELYGNNVVDVTPGESGTPGELTGDFVFHPETIGTVVKNTSRGIFGVADPGETAGNESLPVASKAEIREGPATLMTTVDDGGVRAFACEILRVNPHPETANRAMVIRITDEALLARTGGIVQGMSGSPLIQDGWIVGAVTHVMVNDPAMGYAIDIQSMLDEASDIETDRSMENTVAA